MNIVSCVRNSLRRDFDDGPSIVTFFAVDGEDGDDDCAEGSYDDDAPEGSAGLCSELSCLSVE